MVNVRIKKLSQDAKLPHKSSEKAAAYDLYACIPDHTGQPIQPGETKFIGTGLAMMPEEGYYGAIYARSGLASKRGLRPANCVGIIDEDYRGEIIVALHNDSDKEYVVMPGERIAQIMFQPYQQVEFTEVQELDETGRGDGGFGHSGRL